MGDIRHLQNDQNHLNNDVGDTFQAFHILLALHSMANQLAYDFQDKIKRQFEEYTPSGSVYSPRAYVKKRTLEILP